MIELAPSILSADFARLGEQVRAAAEGGGTVIHVDIMDGHFVPNLTMGPPLVKSLRKVTKLPLDCHLMIENPDEFIPAFAEAGADWISVHQEACRHLNRTLHLIKSHDCLAGVVINPATPVEYPDRSARHCRLCAGDVGESGIWSAEVYSVHAAQNAAVGGDSRAQRGLHYRIEVDGGIALDTVAEVVRAGAEILVAGNAVFGKGDPKKNAQAVVEGGDGGHAAESLSSFRVARMPMSEIRSASAIDN